jgi:nucleoside-diphosphate-sugar epimerase
MSSSAVYGDYEYSISEYANLNPTSAYGVSKAASEFLIKGNLQNWNIVRANMVYGFCDVGERATHLIAKKAFEKANAWVNDLVWCDFIYVKDLVEGISDVLEKGKPKEIFHISGGKAHKLLEYAEELKKYFKFNFETKSVKDRPMRGVLDNSKAKMLLGWQPKYSLKLGVRDYVKYIKRYKIA